VPGAISPHCYEEFVQTKTERPCLQLMVESACADERISMCKCHRRAVQSALVQPDAVCEVGGSTPGLSYGDLGIFLGGGQQRNLYIS